MNKTSTFITLSFLVASSLTFSACSAQAPSPSNETISTESVAPSSMTATSTEKVSFPITDVKLNPGDVLKVKILDSSKKVVAESELLIFSAEAASVTAQGDASAEFTFNEENSVNFKSVKDQTTTTVLYNVAPDSQGRPVETELAKN